MLSRKYYPRRSSRNYRTRSRAGVTLIQILIVIVVVSNLAALFAGILQRRTDSARRAEFDPRLKTIDRALAAFRQEIGHYPVNLEELVAKKYLQMRTAALSARYA